MINFESANIWPEKRNPQRVFDSSLCLVTLSFFTPFKIRIWRLVMTWRPHLPGHMPILVFRALFIYLICYYYYYHNNCNCSYCCYQQTFLYSLLVILIHYWCRHCFCFLAEDMQCSGDCLVPLKVRYETPTLPGNEMEAGKLLSLVLFLLQPSQHTEIVIIHDYTVPG